MNPIQIANRKVCGCGFLIATEILVKFRAKNVGHMQQIIVILMAFHGFHVFSSKFTISNFRENLYVIFNFYDAYREIILCFLVHCKIVVNSFYIISFIVLYCHPIFKNFKSNSSGSYFKINHEIAPQQTQESESIKT